MAFTDFRPDQDPGLGSIPDVAAAKELASLLTW